MDERKEKSLEEQLNDLTKKKDFKNVLDLINSPKNEKTVRDDVWNLITTICLAVKEVKLTHEDVLQCEDVLVELGEKGNPKEVLIALLEMADSFKDNECFCVFLRPLQATLKKIPGKRGKSLEMVMSTLNAHIESLPLQDDKDLKGKEKLLLDADPAVQEFNYVLTNYLRFLEFFIDEVAIHSLHKKEIVFPDRVAYQQDILKIYILKLFHYPFLYQDLHFEPEGPPKSTIRVLCESYIKCLSRLCRNVFSLYQFNSSNDNVNGEEDGISEFDDNENSIPLLAFCNLSYLIHVENVAVDFQPLVYSHKYAFISNLNFVIALLKQKRNLVLFKALYLAKVLLQNLDKQELHYECLELPTFVKFLPVLFNIAIYNRTKEFRKMAIELLHLYINRFDWKAQYHVIMQIVTRIEHSGAQGFAIGLYKDHLHSELNEDTHDKYFISNLPELVKRIFILKDGHEADLLTDHDKVIASLNLLRYLLIRDKRDVNTSGVWSHLHNISKKFLKPLQFAIDFSRAHFKQRIIDVTTKTKLTKDCIKHSVLVDDELLQNPSPELEKHMLKQALVSVDMIESILGRINELIPYST